MKRAVLITSFLCLAGLVPAQGQEEMPAQQFGWQQTPRSVNPEETQRPLTELERLSLSESGVRYDRDVYDPRADNPLEPVSVTLRALDKITARYTDLIIDIDAESRFGTLSIVPRTCDKRPPEEVPEITAFLEVFATDGMRRRRPQGDDVAGDDVSALAPIMEEGEDIGAADPARALPEEDLLSPTQTSLEGTSPSVTTPDSNSGGMTLEDDDGDNVLFRGWMFASSPALNALEHPVYDIWVIDCKMVDPSI